MKDKKLFLKNNLFVFANKIFSKVVTFGIMVIVIRFLDEKSFGDLTILLTLSYTFVFLIDLGTGFIIVRETAIRREDANKIFFGVVALKLVTGAVGYVVLVLLTKILGYNPKVVELSYIFAFGMLFQSLLQTLIKHFEGMELMKYSSLIIVAEKLVMAISLVSFSQFFSLLQAFALSYITSNLLVFIIGTFGTLLNSHKGITFNFQEVKRILSYSLPFVVFTFFSAFYSKLDIYFISVFRTEVELAAFKANYQLIESIYFIPINICITFLPFFSRHLREDTKHLGDVFSRISLQFIKLSLFVTAVLFCGAEIILDVLYSKYQDSYLILQLLALSLPFYFITALNGHMLIALNKERIVTLSIVIVTLSKAVLLYFLLPVYGIYIASAVIVVTDIIAFLIQSIPLYRRGYSVRPPKSFIYFVLALVLYVTIFVSVNSIVILLVLTVVFGFYTTYDIIKLLKENFLGKRSSA